LVTVKQTYSQTLHKYNSRLNEKEYEVKAIQNKETILQLTSKKKKNNNAFVFP